ncbi:raffinose invertase-like [Zerene cesonia]|uniref:raffinose invertase-like n=1 Tax=Zerene cesonia TaxID=33412 RepID=UPI0018E4E096|nr:raffinose invertase-like [Zerene cesonia]
MEMDVFIFLVGLCAVSAEFIDDTSYIESFINQREPTLSRKYRPIFHIIAPDGWISNPAGFTIFKRQYHIFYQYHPYNGAWGRMSWGHAISSDLIEWIHYPAALIPKDYYDKHGCLAGTALVRKNFLTLFYTGHVSEKESMQTQNVALSGNGLIFQKYLYNPLVRDSPNGIGEIRNPKVWRFRNVWYMIVGTTSRQWNGQLVLYTSTDMFNWKHNGTLVESFGDMGYVWENPDLFEIDGYHVLILSVQGIEADGYRFRNLYQNGYVVCFFNYQRARFEDLEVSTATFYELDYGHDFYGAKTLRAPDDRILMVAWLGMWESNFVESTEGWASMLTIIREVSMNKDGRLLLTPIREMVELRSEVLENAWYSPGEVFDAESRSFELIADSRSVDADVGIVFEWKNEGRFTIGYSAEHEYITIDRGGVDGVRRAYWSPKDYVHLRIFVDASSVEVFCGDGEVVFSSRIYPKSMSIRITGEAQLHIVQYRIRRSVGFDAKVAQRLKQDILHKY